MTELQQIQRQLSELAGTIGQAAHQQGGADGEVPAPPSSQDRRTREEALIAQIEKAYKDLRSTKRKLARAELAKRRYETRARINNAEALTAAKNERVASLYLEGILDTEDYRKLVDQEKAAELDHFEARAEVDRLQLTGKLLRATAGGPDDPEAGR